MKIRSKYCTILTLALLCQIGIVIGHVNYNKPVNFSRNDKGTEVDVLCGGKSFTPPKTKPGTTHYKPESYFISLNLWDTFSSRKVKYIRDNWRNIDTFIARYPYLIYKIKEGHRFLWQSRGYKYVHKLKVKYTENRKYDTKMFFVELDRRFGQFTPPGHSLVTLNIKHRHSTDLVKYKMRGHFHIFTARRPFLFDTVFNGNNVIWAPKTHEYPDIVFVKYRTHGNNLLRVFFPRETGRYLNHSGHRSHRSHRKEPKSFQREWKSFISEGKTFKRKEDTAEKNRREAYKHLQDIKLLTEGSSQQNDFAKFDVYKIGKVDQFYMFKFKDGVKCNGIQYVHKMTNPSISSRIFTQDRTVWKQGDSDNSDYPIAVYSHGVYKFLFIEFNENFFYFYRKSTTGKEWKQVKLENVRSLDLSRLKILNYKRGHSELMEMHPDKYLIYNLGFAYQLVFKHGARCEQIQYNDELLYVHDLIGDYPLFVYLMFNKCCEVVYRNTAHYVYT